MKKIFVKTILTSVLLTGAFSFFVSPTINGRADATAKVTNNAGVKNKKYFNYQVNQYMKLLNQSTKTSLINELIKDGRPSSLSDLGSQLSVYSDRDAAKSTNDARANAMFYLRFNRIFYKNINHSFQCDDGNKLSDNLRKIRGNVNAQKDLTNVSIIGMGIGDSLDFGNRPSSTIAK